MKKNSIILLGLIIAAFNVQAQKLKESDLIDSTWKLEINVEDALEEAKEEAEDESLLASVILSSVSGLVEGIMDRIDIYFEFREDNEVKVYVEAFGEDDIEYTTWEINRRGELEIGDTEHFQQDKDESTWIYDNGLLIHEDTDWEDREDPKIFLVRVD